MGKRKNKIENPIVRFLLILLGIAGLVFIVMYSFNFEKFGVSVSIIGYDITEIFIATMIILVGILFSTFFKSGIFGEWIVDS